MANDNALLQEHRSGIQAGIHLHDGDAGLHITRFNRAMNRRRATPARQQRRMDIEAAPLARASQGVQYPLGQEQAVSHHHHRICASLSEKVLRGLRLRSKLAVQTQTGWLRHG